MKKKIAVIGAAGYVGRYVMNRLSHTNAELWAILRHQNTFLIPFAHQVQIKSVAEITSSCKADIVINLAYSIAPDENTFRKENNQLIDIIAQLSHTATHIIHISTLAVFGFQLDKKQVLDLPPSERDYPYVQSKSEMEHLLFKRFPAHHIDIIRPGNVWGPGSPSWTIPVLDALVYDRPILSYTSSYSNITDVNNLADYIGHICEHTSDCSFHHIAELGHIPWKEWIDPLARLVKTNPVLLPDAPPYFVHTFEELRSCISVNPIQTLMTASRSRYWQQPARKAVAMIPPSLKRLRNQEEKPSVYRTGAVFHWIMEAKVLFAHHSDPRWSPPVTYVESLKSVEHYMSESGYLLNLPITS
jgi:nucleoside-diphosphate-sugar epimerase